MLFSNAQATGPRDVPSGLASNPSRFNQIGIHCWVFIRITLHVRTGVRKILLNNGRGSRHLARCVLVGKPRSAIMLHEVQAGCKIVSLRMLVYIEGFAACVMYYRVCTCLDFQTISNPSCSCVSQTREVLGRDSKQSKGYTTSLSTFLRRSSFSLVPSVP